MAVVFLHMKDHLIGKYFSARTGKNGKVCRVGVIHV
jgi:hypothetical protein